jgi:integrase
MTARRPIASPPSGLRQRQRADGSWRIWWEPQADARARGFKPVELDAGKLTWSVREAARLNDAVARGTPSAASRPTGRTIADLIENYRRSPAWERLRPKTRESYARNMATIEAKWGTALVVDFTKPVMNEWYEALLRSGRPSLAQAMIRMMSILFARAEVIGWRAENSNPCMRLKLRTPPPRDRVIDWSELDALLAAADAMGMPQIGNACLLGALQGQRLTDVRQALGQDFHHMPMPGDAADAPPVWVWSLTRSKRGTQGAMQLHPEVVARMIDVLRRTRLLPDAPVIPSPTGRAYSEDLFEKHFQRVRAAAARTQPSVADIQFRDLRRTFGAWSRGGGASQGDVGDVLGNSAATNPRLKATYMAPNLQTASRAVLSIARPADAERKKA